MKARLLQVVGVDKRTVYTRTRVRVGNGMSTTVDKTVYTRTRVRGNKTHLVNWPGALAYYAAGVPLWVFRLK